MAEVHSCCHQHHNCLSFLQLAGCHFNEWPASLERYSELQSSYNVLQCHVTTYRDLKSASAKSIMTRGEARDLATRFKRIMMHSSCRARSTAAGVVPTSNADNSEEPPYPLLVMPRHCHLHVWHAELWLVQVSCSFSGMTHGCIKLPVSVFRARFVGEWLARAAQEETLLALFWPSHVRESYNGVAFTKTTCSAR